MQRARCHLVARQAARVDPGIGQAFAGQFEERHAAVLAGSVIQLEQRGAVAMQERIGDGVAAGHAFVPTAERDRDMREGAGFVSIQEPLKSGTAKFLCGQTQYTRVWQQ